MATTTSTHWQGEIVAGWPTMLDRFRVTRFALAFAFSG